MSEAGADDLIARLLALALVQPSAPAFLAPGLPAMDFEMLADRIRATGARLASWGIQRGDIVAWLTLGRAETTGALAIMPASSTFAPLAPGLTVDAYVALLERLDPKAIALPADISHPIVEAARRLGIAQIAVLSVAEQAAGAFELELFRPRASLESARRVAPEFAHVSATSGTTGRPKLVPHGHTQMMAMAMAMGERLAVGPGDVSGHLTPLHVTGGVRSPHMLSLLNGGAIACLPEADVDALLAAIERGEVTYTSSSFAIMREILRRCDAGHRVKPGRLRFLRVASGRLEPEEMDRLAEAFGVPVVAGLAMTEAGTPAHQHLPPAPRNRGSVGTPLASEIRLTDGNGRIVAPGESGEIQLRGPQVFPGYLDDPELNAQAFIEGWFRTGDLGRFDADGELHIVGRSKEIINRGGEKISPVEVDAALRAIPGVVDAAAFAIPHSALGEEVVAAIVRAPDSALRLADVIAHTRARLGARRAPRHVWFVESLPRSDTGKLNRSSLPQWVGHRADVPPPVADGATAVMRSPIEIALTGLWANALGPVRFDRDDDFFMLGGDSLRGAQLLDEVLSVFGVNIPTDALYDDAGTVAMMAARIETERARSGVRRGASTIPRREADAVIPLSSTQARAWFLQRLDPDGAAYHEARLWEIEGELDVGALQVALKSVAARHSMLRTRFVTVAGVPRQVIDADPFVDLEVVDLPGDPDTKRHRLETAVRERGIRPFDFARATPLRWALFRLGPGRHALLRVWHHILADGLSARILQAEVSDAYAAAKAGRAVALPKPPIDYADLSIWQAQESGGANFERRFEFWKPYLADLPVLALPADFHRPPMQSFRGASVTATLPRESVAALKAIGRAEGATPFASFLAAFAALLSRLSGDADLAIGTQVAGRNLPELKHLIGFFANTVVFRADLSGAPTAGELLARTRDGLREVLLNHDVPFEKLVDALDVPRDPSRNPLFQVAFGMRAHDPVDLEFTGARARRIDAGMERAKFDLTVTLIEWPDRVDMRWEYCADLFRRATIERMIRQYAVLIDAMGSCPKEPVASLPLMDGATRERIVATGHGSRSAFPATISIPQRFAEQVGRASAARAIGALDYAGLDVASNRLAWELRALGVDVGAVVAVARRKSEDIAVAWLAVLKAGGAYLPVDPDLPRERIAYMIADSRVAHAIVDDALAEVFALPDVGIVRPDRDSERIAAREADTLASASRPDDAAYVIYTSGSSGSPKGVVIPHRAVLRLVCGTDCAQICPDDAVAQVANPAFDASTFEFWGALLNGARIVPIAKTIAIVPRELAATIAREHVSALFLTTALFNAVARDAPDAFRACRYVLFGGEAVEPRWVAEVLRAGPPRHLLHVYGPTETTTFATWHEVLGTTPDAATIPIGRPLANTDVFVLRADLEFAAPGEPGEIWIGGPGLALGYLNPSVHEGERFVEHAVANLPALRRYRTGDRARLGDNGAIEFLGRPDRQVKIRGHRIELDEVEAAMARLPEVKAAAVAVRGDTTQTRRLVVYAVPAESSVPPPENLWGRLKPLLPEYMMPSSIVWLKSLPLNSSGKIDRRALPEEGEVEASRTGLRVPPRDMLEQVLARVWQQVLAVGEVGVFDHFFEIGGHSLLAARLFDEIERETGLAAPLAAIFIDDTIAGLARVLRNGFAGVDAPIFAINERGRLPPLVFLHGDLGGGGFYSRSLARALGADQPMLIVQPHGVGGSAIPDTIEAMAAEHIDALQAVWPHGPYLVGGFCNGAFVAFEMARQLSARGEQVPAVFVIEADAPQGRANDAPAVGDMFVTVDGDGAMRVLAPLDRDTDAQLHFSQAMDRYAGGANASHLVLVRSHKLDGARRDHGWARFARSAELHVLPGDHVTLVTHHVDQLARVIGGAIQRVLERAVQ